MTDTPAHTSYPESYPEEHQATDLSEVTFHLAPRGQALPFQWVAGIKTPHESWQSGQEWHSPGELEQLTVDLPTRMSEELLDFARRHIGPNATEKQIDFWCHTFARAVGATALEVTGTAVGGEQGLADAQARILFSEGSKIAPSELAVEEHAVVGDADVNSTQRTPIHSMVGIGRPKGDDTGPTLAVQVDSRNGNLYVGEPSDYLADVKESRVRTRPTTQPQLYVQRTPLALPANHPQKSVKTVRNGYL